MMKPGSNVCKIILCAALCAATLCPVAAGDDAGTVIRRRLDYFLRLEGVDWQDAIANGIARALEYEAGKALETQCRTPGDSYHGAINPPAEGTGSAKRIAAYNTTRRGIHVLTSAYWCKPCRFYRSRRVLKAIEDALNFLARRPPLQEGTSIYDISPPYHYERPDLIRWLVQVGDELPLMPRARLKEKLRRSLPRDRFTIASEVDRIIAGACLGDARLLREGNDNLAQCLMSFKATIRRSGLAPGRGELDLEDNVAALYNTARLALLAAGTDCAPRSIQNLAEHALDLFAWVSFEGVPDALASPAAALSSRQLSTQILLGSAMLLSARPAPLDAKLEATFTAVAARRLPDAPPKIGKLDMDDLQFLIFYPLLRRKPDVPVFNYGTRYYRGARYLVARRPDFFFSLRLPRPGRKIIKFSPATGCSNLRFPGYDPNPLLLYPQFDGMLPGTVVSDNVFSKNRVYPAGALDETKCSDAAVLDQYYAVAGTSLSFARREDKLSARRSWHIFDEKYVMAGSAIEVHTSRYDNQAWAANPLNYRQWIALQFPRPVEFNYARIYFRVHKGRLYCVPRAIRFLASSDGRLWSQLRYVRKALPKSGEVSLGFYGYKLQRGNARIFRLYFPDGADGYATQIAEIELYNLRQPDDDTTPPPGSVNLARYATPVASSFIDAKTLPSLINDGLYVPEKARTPARTCLALSRISRSPFVYGDADGVHQRRYPSVDESVKLEELRWCHYNDIAYFFLVPADVVIRNIRGDIASIYLDHSRFDTYAVLCFPGRDRKEAQRAAGMDLVQMLALDRKRHIFRDPYAQVTTAAFFEYSDKGAITSNGPAYAVLSPDGVVLNAAKSVSEGPADVMIRGLDVRRVILNEVESEPHIRKGAIVLSTQ